MIAVVCVGNKIVAWAGGSKQQIAPVVIVVVATIAVAVLASWAGWAAAVDVVVAKTFMLVAISVTRDTNSWL